MKKSLAILATAGILATALIPAAANASTTPYVAKTNSTAASFSIVPEGIYTNSWGTASLTANDIDGLLTWKLTPANMSKSYVYDIMIDFYTPDTLHSYLGTLDAEEVSGSGVLTGTANYPSYMGTGTYYAKLTGTWTASDGTSGRIDNGPGSGAAGATFRIGY